MKVYSRAQVVVCSALTGLIVFLLVWGLGLVELPLGRDGAAEAEAEALAQAAEQPTAAESGSADEGERQRETTVALGNLELRQTDYNPFQVNAAELQGYDTAERENISVYEQLNEAVVNITTETVAYDWFLQPVPQEGGSGSGSIIDTRGYVLTNRHVVEDAYKVFINLADGTQIEGQVVGTDTDNDIAVLKFSPPKGMDLKTVPFGDSSNLKVGQKVMAIGNPFGFERTLTVGIISGLGRPIQTSRNHIVQDMIQTDASINPGNSGGPLLDARGRMIGINTTIYTTSGGSVGVGFAVPVNTAKRVVPELIEFGKVKRGWIDATVVQLTSAIVDYAKLSVKAGLLVSRVKRNGFAEKAGLKQGDEQVRYGSSVLYLGGDIITEVDGMKTESIADLFSALEDNKPGDKVRVSVDRAGKKTLLTITLADREELINQ